MALRRLQPSATDQTILVGGQKSNKTGKKSKDLKKYYKAALKTDLQDSKKNVDKENSTASSTSQENVDDNEDVQYMINPEVTEAYWKKLAEQRQLALEDTLKENEYLKELVEVMEVENAQLKEQIEAAEEVLKLISENVLEENTQEKDETSEREHLESPGNDQSVETK